VGGEKNEKERGREGNCGKEKDPKGTQPKIAVGAGRNYKELAKEKKKTVIGRLQLRESGGGQPKEKKKKIRHRKRGRIRNRQRQKDQNLVRTRKGREGGGGWSAHGRHKRRGVWGGTPGGKCAQARKGNYFESLIKKKGR